MAKDAKIIKEKNANMIFSKTFILLYVPIENLLILLPSSIGTIRLITLKIRFGNRKYFGRHFLVGGRRVSQRYYFISSHYFV